MRARHTDRHTNRQTESQRAQVAEGQEGREAKAAVLLGGPRAVVLFSLHYPVRLNVPSFDWLFLSCSEILWRQRLQQMDPEVLEYLASQWETLCGAYITSMAQVRGISRHQQLIYLLLSFLVNVSIEQGALGKGRRRPSQVQREK